MRDLAPGLTDVLIACIDNLTGFAEAISTIFPEAIIQNSVIQEMDATALELGVTTGQLRIKFGKRMPLARQNPFFPFSFFKRNEKVGSGGILHYINTR